MIVKVHIEDDEATADALEHLGSVPRNKGETLEEYLSRGILHLCELLVSDVRAMKDPTQTSPVGQGSNVLDAED